MGKIYYIGAYSGDEERLRRKHIRQNPAGTAKMDYILYALNQIGKTVTLVAVAPSKDSGFCHQESIAVSEREQHTYLASAVCRIFGKNIIRGELSSFFLERYLLENVTAEDTVIVYHSLLYKKAVVRAWKKQKFRLLLEVEELYQDVIKFSESRIQLENELVNAADGYLLSTNLLKKRINKAEKPSIVVNGNYRMEAMRGCHFDDNKIHCVYAGTLDLTKGGAAAAAAAAAELPREYHIHILGFGTEKELAALQQIIEQTRKKGCCALTYDGVLHGEEFIRFLQKCQIGLCTQIPDAAYAATSFPSKILTYLVNGLKVVSSRHPVVEQSEIGKIMFFYDEQTPKAIARAVEKAAKAKARQSSEKLDELDKQFQKELNILLG